MTDSGEKYLRTIYPRGAGAPIKVDIYRVLDAYPLSPPLQHAAKKLLCPGQRGGKSFVQDLEEAIVCIRQGIELYQTKEEYDEPPVQE